MEARGWGAALWVGLLLSCSKSAPSDTGQGGSLGTGAASGVGAASGSAGDAGSSGTSSCGGVGGTGATGATGGTGGTAASAGASGQGTGGATDGGTDMCDGGMRKRPQQLYPYNDPETGRGVFVDNTVVYWASKLNSGSLRKAPKEGGGTPVSLGHSDLSGMPSLVADEDSVYYLTAGNLRKWPQGAGNEGVVLLKDTDFTQSAIYSDGKSLFMAGYCCTVMGKVEKDGTGLVQHTVSMAVEAGGFCGTSLNETGLYCSDGPRIFQMGLDAAEPQLMHTLPDARETRGLVVAGGDIYWLEGGRGGAGHVDLMTRPIAGGAAVKLGQGPVGTNGAELVFDAQRQRIYWAEELLMAGWDMKSQKLLSGFFECGVRPLGYLSQDEDFLYWIETTGVYRMDKDDIFLPSPTPRR